MTSVQAPIVSEQTYSASVAEVWKAITEPKLMRQWFFEPIPDFRAEVGFQTEFVVHCEGTDYPHLWKITEVVPESKIVYDWRYGGIPGAALVTWELSESEQGTTLKLTQEIVEPFPPDNPIFSREAGQAGWDYFVRESLPKFLAG